MDDEAAAIERQAQRLATLAALARPVQHEINNLLTVVFANLELLKRTAAEGAPQRQLDRIYQASKRLEVSTRGILSLSRRPVPDEAEVAPLVALRALLPLLHVILSNPGSLVVTLPEDEPWTALLDRAALDEVVLGLAREAAVAMPRGSTFRLTLTQEDEVITLVIAWPEGAPAPAGALAEALTALGAEPLPDHRWQLRWPRVKA